MNRRNQHNIATIIIILILCTFSLPAAEPEGIMYWRPYFGARFDERSGLGIKVTHVDPGSPADSIGMSAGDVIYEFGDKNFYKREINPDALTDAILLAPVDKPVKVVFQHITEKKTVSVQLRQQPFLGIMFSGHEGQGFLVRDIIQNAPAGKLGLQNEDLIIGYAGKCFTGTAIQSRILAEEIAKSPFNTPLNLKLLRKGRIIDKVIIYRNSHVIEPGPKAPVGESGVGETEIPKGEVLISDDFNTENGGKGRSNYKDFANWEVTRGEVDLIGKGFFDHQPGNGLYVDLDGSKEGFSTATVAGTLTSRKIFTLEPGSYILKFDLAGHPYQGPNTVIVKLADVYRSDFTLGRQIAGTGFRTYTRTIKVDKETKGNLIFEHRGGDFSGLLLDNVSLIRLQQD